MRPIFRLLTASALAIVVSTLALGAQTVCKDCLWARYWTVPLPATACQARDVPCFPETDAVAGRPSLGVAFSGGGTRSATMVAGQLRGLRHTGILDKVRYVSAVSGGGWASVPFVYTKSPLDVFLGAYQTPLELRKEPLLTQLIEQPNGELSNAIVKSSLTAGSVQEVAGDLATAFTNQLGQRMLQSLTSSLNGLKRREPDRLNKTYARLLGGLFVDPLIDPGTTAGKRLFSWNADTVRDISETSQGHLGGDFVVAGPDRPFLIAGGTVIVARRDYVYPLLMPIEYTPMYVGVRQRFGGRFGGTYISPWAYDSTQTGAVNQKDGLVQVHYDSARAFTLGDVVGSTGAAPQLALVLGSFVPEGFKARVQQVAGVFPAFRHFTLENDGTRSFLTEEIAHGDGGFGDNLGVMPLLARGVKNIMVFVNTSTELVENNDDLKSLFFPAGPPGSSGDKTFNRVFWCSETKQECDAADRDTYYRTLVSALIARRDAHKAQVFCAGPWKVRANDHFNVGPIEPGVNVCWFYNSTADAWEADLPPRLIEMVHGRDKSKAGKNFDHFPWLATFGQNKTNVIRLTAPQVNLLSNLTAWIVANDETQDMIKRTLSY